MNFTSIKDLSRYKILSLIIQAIKLKEKLNARLPEDVANIFMEPSTRTLLSFQRAEGLLGMRVYNVVPKTSSFVKGETLMDTIINLKAIGIKTFVIRSNVAEYWKEFEGITGINIINAGDGNKNHPTQAMLDAMTIYEEFKTLDNLKILIVGDLKHSRVYSSLCDLFKKFESTVKPFSIFKKHSPEELKAALHWCDVVVMLRVQHERHATKTDITNYNNKYGLNLETINFLRLKAIFMHPGPVNRGVEITKDLLYLHPKCRILEQVNNGLYMRVAILLNIVCKPSS